MNHAYPALVTVAQLQTVIDANPFCSWLQMRVESIDNSGVVLSVPGRDEMIGTLALQRLHGGIVASLIDSACGFAVVAACGVSISAISLQSDFHRPAPLGLLRIKGYVQHIGGRICTATAQIFDSQDTLIASGNCSIYKTQTPHPALLC